MYKYQFITLSTSGKTTSELVCLCVCVVVGLHEQNSLNSGPILEQFN